MFVFSGIVTPKTSTGGAVYIRWGRKVCPQNGAELLYSGTSWPIRTERFAVFTQTVYHVVKLGWIKLPILRLAIPWVDSVFSHIHVDTCFGLLVCLTGRLKLIGQVHSCIHSVLSLCFHCWGKELGNQCFKHVIRLVWVFLMDDVACGHLLPNI